MNKADTLKKLTSLEDEAKELRKILEAPDKPIDIKERVKTFEDACMVTGEDPIKCLPYANPSNSEELAANYMKMQRVVAKALNEGWKLDWSNGDQPKWYPWMQFNKAVSAFRFGFSFYYFVHASAGGGVRRVFETEEQSQIRGEWWWKNNIPKGIEIEDFYCQ